jgi:hypothetical protein
MAEHALKGQRGHSAKVARACRRLDHRDVCFIENAMDQEGLGNPSNCWPMVGDQRLRSVGELIK